MSSPKVTVLMPVFNSEKYLNEAIGSVLSQSFIDFELLIINDGSTDDSVRIIQEYQGKDNRIVYVKNERNVGIQKTLNKGISLSQGGYIARMDSDDIWCDQKKLQKQLDFLDNNPDYALVGTAMETIDTHGDKLQIIKYKETDKEIRNSILFSSQFAHPSIIIRKSALESIGNYSEEKKHRNVEDYELWLRIGTRFKFANLGDICLKYRIHPQSVSMQNEFRHRLNWIAVTMKYAKYYPHASKAIIAKISTLIISRKFLGNVTKKSRLIATIYSNISGIQKESD